MDIRYSEVLSKRSSQYSCHSWSDSRQRKRTCEICADKNAIPINFRADLLTRHSLSTFKPGFEITQEFWVDHVIRQHRNRIRIRDSKESSKRGPEVERIYSAQLNGSWLKLLFTFYVFVITVDTLCMNLSRLTPKKSQRTSMDFSLAQETQKKDDWYDWRWKECASFIRLLNSST